MFKAPFAMIIDSLSYLWSAFFVFLIRRPEPPVPKHDEEAHGPKPSMRQEIVGRAAVRDGPSLAARDRRHDRHLELLRQRHGRDRDPVRDPRAATSAREGIGFAFSIGSVGVLVAALVTSRITARVGVGRMLVLSAVGFSLLGPAGRARPGRSSSSRALALFGLVGGFFGVAWNINQVSLRQAITPPRMQGRMNATMRFIVWGTIPLGAIIGGALGDIIGLHATIWVGALGSLVAFLPVALSSVRQIVTMPEPTDDDAAPRDADRRTPARLSDPVRPRCVEHRDADAALAGDLDRALVAGVDVAHDAHRRDRS